MLHDALSWARHLEESGRIPLLIEGDDGTRLDRRAIVDALSVGIREQLVSNQLVEEADVSRRAGPTRPGPVP